jgi:HB1, ASXL, restriction endonuclease HTH domain
MTLHEAIEEILKDNGQPMTTQEIADELNEKGLYQRGDGNPITRKQVSARISKYQHLFNRNNGFVSLAE